MVLTDNEGIHQINLDMRGIDRPTDVLSFPMCDFETPGGICYFTSDDVVRHPLVQKIVKAYDEYEARGKGAKKPDRQAGRDGRNDSNHRV